MPMKEIFDPFGEPEKENAGGQDLSPVPGADKNCENELEEKEKAKDAAKFVRRALESEIKSKIRLKGFGIKGRGSTWLKDRGDYYEVVYLQKSYLDVAPRMSYKIEVGVVDRKHIKKTEDFFNTHPARKGKPPVIIAQKDLDIANCRNEDRFELGKFVFTRPDDEKGRDAVIEQIAAIGRDLDQYLDRIDAYGKKLHEAGFPHLRSRDQGPAF